MTKIVATIYEPTVERALDAIAAVEADVDAIELRADRLEPHGAVDCRPFRQATSREMIFTRRTSMAGPDPCWDELEAALAAGIEWVDVELHPALNHDRFASIASRAILSHHDFRGVMPLSAILSAMEPYGAAHMKVALSPATFEENLILLRDAAPLLARGNFTMIGMGASGLYCRMLAPFFGSELVFVARDASSIAAPGQLTLTQARTIYGRGPLTPPMSLFAVAGNPAAHSRSPLIHNPAFRDERLAAAYAVIEVADFSEVSGPFLREESFAPRGLSVTSPFKEEAFEFAAKHAEVTKLAAEARAVNTLVRLDGKIIADNTDVSALLELLEGNAAGTRAAVVGAGGTARAALVALRRMGVTTTIYNRSSARGQQLADEFGAAFRPLDALNEFDGELVISTLPAGSTKLTDDQMSRLVCVVDVVYGSRSQLVEERRRLGLWAIDGLDMLEAQARGQFRWFRESCESAAMQSNVKREDS